jgi:hypothetical protein
MDPAIGRDPVSGDLLLTWDEEHADGWHLRFARSTDGGRTWSAPVAVTRAANDVHPHPEASPRLIAGGDGTIGISWINSYEVAGRQWPASHVRFARSRDGGTTWDEPVTVNDDASGAPGGHNFHGAVAVNDSTYLIAWLDERPAPGPNSRLYVSESHDRGATWGANRAVADSICPCCRVTLAAGPGGAVAAWRGHLPGDVRDVLVAPIVAGAAGAAPFETAEPRLVAADGWVMSGCPHTGPALGVDRSGRTHVAWYTGAAGRTGIYYRELDGGPAAAAAAPLALVNSDSLSVSHLSLAVLPSGGAVVVYEHAIGDDPGLVAARVSNGVVNQYPIPSSSGSDHPQVVGDADGAVIAWTVTGVRPAIELARVGFGGSTARNQ